jgi:hypothetical protein
LLWEIERPHLLAQELRVEERFGFDSYLPGAKVGGQHRTSSNERRKAG